MANVNMERTIIICCNIANELNAKFVKIFILSSFLFTK